jgi:hypothetical protein
MTDDYDAGRRISDGMRRILREQNMPPDEVAKIIENAQPYIAAMVTIGSEQNAELQPPPEKLPTMVQLSDEVKRAEITGLTRDEYTQRRDTVWQSLLPQLRELTEGHPVQMAQLTAELVTAIYWQYRDQKQRLAMKRLVKHYINFMFKYC